MIGPIDETTKLMGLIRACIRKYEIDPIIALIVNDINNLSIWSYLEREGTYSTIK